MLTSFGGHPLAAGLSLPVANLALFTEAINQQLRQQTIIQLSPIVTADLTVTVADLGEGLFQELKLLEPCGMGNPVPRLLLQNVWFDQVRKANMKDQTGQKLRYLKTEFRVRDASATRGFPGVWWEHSPDDLPARADAIVELDFNAVPKEYHIRLVAVRAAQGLDTPPRLAQTDPIARQIPNTGHFAGNLDWLWDWRYGVPESAADVADPLIVTHYPTYWHDFAPWLEAALAKTRPLAIAFPPPIEVAPIALWERLLGMAKYLSRTQQPIVLTHWANTLGIPPAVLDAGLAALATLGVRVEAVTEQSVVLQWSVQDRQPDAVIRAAIAHFFTGFQENQFRQRYFYQVPWPTIQAMVTQILHSGAIAEPSSSGDPRKGRQGKYSGNGDVEDGYP